MLPKTLMTEAGIDPATLLGSKADILDDLGESRLRCMDTAGIDVQVLSAVGHVIQRFETGRSVSASRETNDVMSRAVLGHPERFRAFATLPMSDPMAAALELRRCVEELGFVGAMVHGQTDGMFLDHPAMRPVLAAAQALHVPVYLHPAPPPQVVFDAYFLGLEPAAANMLATGGWGWHAECGLHVLRMVLAGTFDLYPDLQIIVGHMGENLPFSLARADDWLTPLAGGLSESVAETVRRHVHITIGGYTTVAPLLCALMVFGTDRMMFSVDYPFSDNSSTAGFLAEAPLSPTDRDKIGYLNAQQLLGL